MLFKWDQSTHCGSWPFIDFCWMQKRNRIINYGRKMRGFWVKRLAWVQVMCRPLVCAWPQNHFLRASVPSFAVWRACISQDCPWTSTHYGSRNALDKKDTQKMVGVLPSRPDSNYVSHIFAWLEKKKMMSDFEYLFLIQPSWSSWWWRVHRGSGHPNQPSIPTLLKLVFNKGAWSKPSFPGSDESHSLLKSLSCGL